MTEAGERSERRPGLGRALLALGLLAPTVLHLVGRGGEGALFVLAGVALPLAVARLRATSEAQREGRVLAVALAAALVVPVLPTLAGLFGFSLERVVLGATLAWLAWRGRLTPSASASPPVLLARTAVLAWASWSVASAIRASWVAFPEGAPGVGHAFGAALLDPLGFRSMVDPTYPLLRLVQRLELLVLLWATLEVALLDRELPKRLARGFAVALPVGVLVNLVAILFGFSGSAHPLAVRFSSSLDRVFRPLPDHNALGSALVLVLPPVLWLVVRCWRARSRLPSWLSLGAAACGGALLVGTSSKSAMLGVVVALGTGVSLWIAQVRGKARVVLGLLLGAGLALCIGVQLLPRESLVELMEVRYARDVVRAARFDFVQDYLAANRYAVWSSATAMLDEEPLTGVGLGRFPRRMADFHDPEAEGHFNPLQENAHSQYLQWAAEEGVVGLALGLALFVLALVAGVRTVLGRRPERSVDDRLLACAFTAALAGLALNLSVGHALLVPTVAALFAVTVAVLVAGVGEPTHPGRRWPRLAGLAFVLFPVGLAPLASAERDPLESYQVGCFPWLWQPGGGDLPTVSRLLGPDARWMQRWGGGSRMLLLAKSITAPHYGEDQVLEVRVDGVLVVEGFRLPRKQPHEPFNPVVVLKVDAPEGVHPGDLVELRVTCTNPYAESIAGGHSQSIWGPRVWPPTFTTPGRR